MSNLIKIINIVKTCNAYPAQWEAQTAEGLIVYIRFRWGYLSIRTGKNLEEAISEKTGVEIFEKQLKGDMNNQRGEMTFDELKEITKGIIEWVGEEVKR